MGIDDKPVATWIEQDLAELCSAGRLENPRLEFKEMLILDRDGQKDEAERDVVGMAASGGGVIIYGVSETAREDGSRVANALTPLQDGSLYERLNNVLDGRTDPKIPFSLHAVPCATGGVFLVVEIFGRLRPHMAHDGRYYVRRNLLVRRMTEAEVADAYRERFLRERAAQPDPMPTTSSGLPISVDQRVHRGLRPAEFSLYRQETGFDRQPGWLSVVASPDPPVADLVDPTEVPARVLQALTVDPLWNPHEQPLAHFSLQATLDGFRAQLPPRDDVFPAYLIEVHSDGVMEFGTTLEPVFLREEAAANRVIPTLSVAHYIHDYLLLFAGAFRQVDYHGPIVAQVRFDHVLEYRLGVRRSLARQPKLIDRDIVEGPVWRGTADALEAESGLITKKALDRLFLAAGLPGGSYIVDESGELADDGAG